MHLPLIYSLQDLDDGQPDDDMDLLEEMALYEEQGEGLVDDQQEGGGAGLTDSKNDDELMLQMEELM